MCAYDPSRIPGFLLPRTPWYRSLYIFIMYSLISFLYMPLRAFALVIAFFFRDIVAAILFSVSCGRRAVYLPKDLCIFKKKKKIFFVRFTQRREVHFYSSAEKVSPVSTAPERLRRSIRGSCPSLYVTFRCAVCVVESRSERTEHIKKFKNIYKQKYIEPR